MTYSSSVLLPLMLGRHPPAARGRLYTHNGLMLRFGCNCACTHSSDHFSTCHLLLRSGGNSPTSLSSLDDRYIVSRQTAKQGGEEDERRNRRGKKKKTNEKRNGAPSLSSRRHIISSRCVLVWRRKRQTRWGRVRRDYGNNDGWQMSFNRSKKKASINFKNWIGPSCIPCLYKECGSSIEGRCLICPTGKTTSRELHFLLLLNMKREFLILLSL